MSHTNKICQIFSYFSCSILPNTVQLHVVTHLIKSGINRFPRENRFGGNGSSDARSKQIYNLLHITLNHVPSYNGTIDGVYFRYTYKVVDVASRTSDVDEYAMIRKN